MRHTMCIPEFVKLFLTVYFRDEYESEASEASDDESRPFTSTMCIPEFVKLFLTVFQG